jgi:hypothetical protein
MKICSASTLLLRWHWKKDQIQTMVVTDNVADLMTAKLENSYQPAG